MMLIELRLIGADHAWQRVAQTHLRREIDRRLLVFDFLEGCLSQELSIPPAAFEAARSFEKLDPYEEYLLFALVEGSLSSSEKIQALSKLSSKLPWSSYLRLLCLTANLETQNSAKLELNRKIQLIIRGLDPRSQQLWNLRLKQALQMPELQMQLSARERTLIVMGKSIDLSKKKIAFQLLESLCHNPSLSIDQTIQLLWQTPFSPECYHRLRMSVHRLNTLIFEVTGLGKIIEVDSQNTRLRPEIHLRLLGDSPGLDLPN